MCSNSINRFYILSKCYSLLTNQILSVDFRNCCFKKTKVFYVKCVDIIIIKNCQIVIISNVQFVFINLMSLQYIKSYGPSFFVICELFSQERCQGGFPLLFPHLELSSSQTDSCSRIGSLILPFYFTNSWDIMSVIHVL